MFTHYNYGIMWGGFEVVLGSCAVSRPQGKGAEGHNAIPTTPGCGRIREIEVVHRGNP